LQRRTRSGHWIPEIDGLRFVAIAAVVLYHMRGELTHNGFHPVQSQFVGFTHVLDLGRRGVQLFFVISGFSLGQPFAAHYLQGDAKPSLRKYYLRRLTRLEPPYLFNILVSAILLYLAWRPAFKQLVLHLLASIAYLDTCLSHFQGGLPISGVAWTLEVEIQFYIVAPLLAWSLYRTRPAWLRRLFFFSVMIAAAWAQRSVALGPENLLHYLQYFLAGMLLADIDLQTLAHTRRSFWWDTTCAAWPIVFWIAEGESFWLAPLTILLYAGVLHGRVVRSLLRAPLLAVTGGMCYTIYLWHPIAMSGAQRLLSRADHLLPTNYGTYFAIQAVVKTIAIGAVSVPMFLLLERPCMDPRWPARLWAYLHNAPETLHNARPARVNKSAHDLAA
jgi:peptidoglycan/LPS O-acetylase OafA/YrhL